MRINEFENVNFVFLKTWLFAPSRGSSLMLMISQHFLNSIKLLANELKRFVTAKLIKSVCDVKNSKIISESVKHWCFLKSFLLKM